MANVRPTFTVKRRDWLLQLRDSGPAASHSVVGYHCRKLGWTEWFLTLKDGRAMPLSEAKKTVGTRVALWSTVEGPTSMECITEAGRAKLLSTEA